MRDFLTSAVAFQTSLPLLPCGNWPQLLPELAAKITLLVSCFIVHPPFSNNTKYRSDTQKILRNVRLACFLDSLKNPLIYLKGLSGFG